MDGLLLLDKPAGPTSHDVVEAVRGLLGGAKAGHSGTLDPGASGLLVLMVGRATKLAPYLPADPKVYEGSILLGVRTDSMDVAGEVVAEGSYGGGPEQARLALASLVGEVDQVPPMFSAVKYRGEPLYRYARRGEEVPRRSRRIRVYGSEMTAFRALGSRAEVDFLVSCSPGTYVRELAARVGELLGCGGAISRLRRLSSGPFRLEEASPLEGLLSSRQRAELVLLPLERAVDGYRKVVVSGAWSKAARNGAPLREEMVGEGVEGVEEGEIVAVVDEAGKLVGMHEVVERRPFTSRPRRII